MSRKSLIRPFLATHPSYHLFFQVVLQSFPRKFSIREFFRKLDIQLDDKMKKLVRKYGYSLETTFNPCDIEHDLAFQRLYVELLQVHESDNLKALKAFKTYLAQCGVHSGQRIGIFDVGWRGSIQFLMERIINQEVYGYYLFIDASVFGLSHTRGFLAENRRDVYAHSGYTSLLELVFSASHGSVSGYTLKHGFAKVRFSDYEHGDDEEEAKLKALREGTLECHRDLFMHNIYGSLAFHPKEYASFLKLAGENPTRYLVDLFDVFHFEDGQILPLIGGDSLIQSFLHPKDFIRKFMRSNWKIGFLRKYSSLPFGAVFLAVKNALIIQHRE